MTTTCFRGETILLAARRVGVDTATACLAGICGTCQVPCLSGETARQQNGGS